MGVEKVEEYVKGLFRDYDVNRMDSDAMRTRASSRKALTALWAGKTDILVGTQMIAKGLDFLNVTLVGVISGDTALYLKDFRSAERTFQLITQVAGRTGRRLDNNMPAILASDSGNRRGCRTQHLSTLYLF